VKLETLHLVKTPECSDQGLADCYVSYVVKFGSNCFVLFGFGKVCSLWDWNCYWC